MSENENPRVGRYDTPIPLPISKEKLDDEELTKPQIRLPKVDRIGRVDVTNNNERDDG